MELLNTLIHNPVIQGLLLKVSFEALKVFFGKVDESGKAQKAEPWLQPSLIVLTTLASAVELALEGKLSTLDTQNLYNLVYMYLGAKSAGSKSVVKAVEKLKKGK